MLPTSTVLYLTMSNKITQIVTTMKALGKGCLALWLEQSNTSKWLIISSGIISWVMIYLLLNLSFLSLVPLGIIIDTLILSRLYHPNLLDIDKKHAWKHMPLQLYGRHSLESYGYRLGEYKGSFAHNTDWKNWSQEMEDYCVQDVNVTTKLWNHFLPYLNGSR